MRRHASTLDRPRRVRCDGCGEYVPNTRHPDIDQDEDHYCSLACLEGRSQDRVGTPETPLVADGGEPDAE
jgi:hypothetical protein